MSWYDAIKVAGDAIEKLKNAELNQLLATVRMEGAKLAEENARLREENLALRETVRLRGAMIFRDDTYWVTVGEGKEEGPFCQTCWDGSKKLARLRDVNDNEWGCTVCEKWTYKPGGRERQRADSERTTRARRSPTDDMV